jgi:hypothetical protein
MLKSYLLRMALQGGATAAADPEHGVHAGLPHPRHLLPAPLHHPASRGGGDGLPSGGGHRYDSRPGCESRLHREADPSAETVLWIRIQWGRWICVRIRIGNPDPGGQK